jgi:hypothetical protein
MLIARSCIHARLQRLTMFLLFLSPGLAFASEGRADPPRSVEAESGRVMVHRNVVQLGLIAMFFRGRDQLASPLAYQGLLWGGRLSYEYRGQRGWHWLKTDVVVGRPTPVVGSRDDIARVGFPWGQSYLLGANLRYGYHHVVARFAADRLVLLAGGLLTGDARVFVPTTQSNIFFRVLGWSLNAGAMACYRPASRHLIVAHLFVPFLTYLVRTPWPLYDNPSMKLRGSQFFFQGHMTSLNGYQAATARAHYEYEISPRWSATATYQLSFVNTPTPPKPITLLESSLLVGFSFSF